MVFKDLLLNFVLDRKLFKLSFQGYLMTEDETEKKKSGWKKLKISEIEEVVVKLANEGNSPAKIGLILRDQHGVPKVKLSGKKITQILKEKGIEFDTDKNVVEKRIVVLKEHLKDNKHDYSASRALTKKLWVVNKAERRSKAN